MAASVENSICHTFFHGKEKSSAEIHKETVTVYGNIMCKLQRNGILISLVAGPIFMKNPEPVDFL